MDKVNFFQVEKDVLSSAILKHDCLIKLMDAEAEIFQGDNRIIFEGMRDLYEDGLSIDLASLSVRLREQGKKISDKLLVDLFGPSTVINFDYLFRKLYERYYKTQLLDLSKDLYKAVKEGIDFPEFVDSISEITDKIHAPASREYISISEIGDIGELYKKSTFYRTGLKSLDDVIIGFFRGQLIILGGRPKRGKTTLALNILKNIGFRYGEVLFFSLEMNYDEIYAKLLASESSVEAWKIEIDKLTDEERGRVIKADSKLQKGLKMTIFDGDLHITKIKNYIKKFMEAKEPVVICVDYLQLISGGSGSNEHSRIGKISREFKNIARKYKVPMLVLSQLSRNSERENRAPVSSDLRESGAIEADADAIIFVHENKEKETEIIIGDARKTRKGIIRGIEFDKPFSRFQDVEEFNVPEYFHD